MLKKYAYQPYAQKNAQKICPEKCSRKYAQKICSLKMLKKYAQKMLKNMLKKICLFITS